MPALAASLLVAPLLAAPLIVVLVLPAHAAEWTVVPGVRLRESYSDNIRLAPAQLAQPEWTTEVAPTLTVGTNSRRLSLSLDYSLQKLMYSHEPDRTEQQLAANGHSELMQDWLYLDARASISRQAISAFGSQRSDVSQIDANTNVVHANSVTPYLKHVFRGLAAIELRHSYDHVSSGSLLSVRSNDTRLQVTGDNGGQGWNWDLTLDRNVISDSQLAPVTMSNAALTLSMPVNSRFSLYGTGGYEKEDYHALSGQPGGRYWSAGGTWTPSPRTTVSASVGHRYFGKTGKLDARYRMRRMFWTLAYNEDITTTHAQFLSLPPTALGDFLNQLWSARIPDAALRQQTVKAFLQLSQMLGAQGNVDYFSHRYYLQKQASLSTVYSGAKSTLALGWSRTGRTAQTTGAVDSILLEPAQLALEDRTRQTALQLGWNWRLSPRGSLNVSASRGVIDSLSTGRSDRNTAIGAGLLHQWNPRLSTSIDLRRTRHTSNAGGDYRENGVSAALVLLF